MADPAELLALRAVSLRGPVACVDLETTGGLSGHHRIIEVGIVLLDGGEVVEEWSTLVQPGVRIPSGIAAFTGIDDSMVAGAPCFTDVAAEVRRRLDGRLFVAHNARFDYGFLRAEFRRLGERFSAPVLCTVRLSRALYAEHPRHNLDTLMERFGLTCTARHRALGDAQVLPALLAAIERQRGAQTLHEAVTEALREPRLPAHLPAELADDLPDAPGVYLFRGEDDALLYLGKSRNIRSRVFDHFTGGHRSGKHGELTAQVRKVEWIETGGELGALLLETRLLKELAPPGNRRPRNADEDCVVRLVRSADGLVPTVEPLSEAVVDDQGVLFGPFRSEKDARRALEGKAREAALCLKTLGLEHHDGSCIGYQLRKCRGACVGREPRALHDTRLQLALASLRLKSWPFRGPIGIREPAPDARGTWVHVLDQWRHLGTARDEREVGDVLRHAGPAGFDADGYRIIARALKDVRPRDLLTFDRPAESP
ncbi:MAG: polymerase epsilon subunit [Steroidobacteraceae bacterium]|nr:polymerase epsilon subunit [Steroidobacteraceae bacterium]